MKILQTISLKYTYLLLFLIILLGGFFRFYQLSTVPPSLNWDEVAFGYNAYSLLQTGKDEYGSSWPVYLRSFDDYKRPVYTYATVASVALFGPNEFGVRFPSAFIGTLSILLIYFLAKEIFMKKSVALLAAFFLAILPWHIQFSHAGFEAVLGFFFTTLGVLCTVKALRTNLWYLPIASLSFGLSLYSYLGQRVAVPILCITLFILYFQKLRKVFRKKQAYVPIVIAGIIMTFFVVMVMRDTMQPAGNLRYKATSIFTHSDEYQKSEERMQVDAIKKINLTRKVFHDNRAFTSLQLVISGYLTHFSPSFFFFDFGQHHQAPGLGNLYIWMLPFLVFGFYYLCKNETTEVKAILFAWLLGPPLAAAVTFQVPHSLRVGDMMIPIVCITAYGAYCFFVWLRKLNSRLVIPVLGLFILTGCIYLLYFFHQYFIHFPIERSKEWVYGRKEAVLYAEMHKTQYDKIIVSTGLDYPYIFFLFYTKYDPKQYLREGGTVSGGFAEEGNAFGKYEFHRFDYDKDSVKGKYLFIGKPDEFPQETAPLMEINYLNGDKALYIVESEPK